MTSLFKSSVSAALKPLLLASMMAGAAFSALAQAPPPGPMGGPGGEHRGMMRHGPMDPAKMQAMVVQRQAALKEKLKITPAQEGAWTAFTSIMQPSVDMHKRRMEMRAEMDQRANATKTFYAALTPEQQKVFDAQRMRGGPGHGQGRRHG